MILRLRERSDVGSTFIDVLRRYAAGLAAVGSKLVIVSLNEPLAEQFRATGFTEFIGPENLYRADERVGAAARAGATRCAGVDRDTRPERRLHGMTAP